MHGELVSVLMDLFHKVRVALRALSNQKERRLDLILCQNIQHLRRVAGMWPIVKGQGDLATGDIPIK